MKHTVIKEWWEVWSSNKMNGHRIGGQHTKEGAEWYINHCMGSKVLKRHACIKHFAVIEIQDEHNENKKPV